eukprot:Hpha_TRINITY_DN13974_c0_g1::TRINITY_DN13974_c0_g1_i1::g.35791::m.35791
MRASASAVSPPDPGDTAPAEIFLERVPTELASQVPTGIYKRSSRIARGRPIFERVLPNGQLLAIVYTGPNGKWFFGDQDDITSGYTENAGWIASARAHGGLWPHQIDSWTMHSDSASRFVKTTDVVWSGPAPQTPQEPERTPDGPRRLRVTVTEGSAAEDTADVQARVAGEYTLDTELFANGHFVYRRVSGVAILYTSRKGKWFFGDTDDIKTKFSEEAGWVASTAPHRGAEPHLVDSWDVYNSRTRRWQRNLAVIQVQAVSTSGTPITPPPPPPPPAPPP